MDSYDTIIIGRGPGGTTAASVLILERERFPRFRIGESLFPERS